jgi:hypothetical protein
MIVVRINSQSAGQRVQNTGRGKRTGKIEIDEVTSISRSMIRIV